MHVSSCPNSKLISIKAQLNSTYIIVFIVLKSHTSNSMGSMMSVSTPGRGKKFFLSQKYPGGL